MIGARKVVRRAFGLMVPRTSQKIRRNGAYRWPNRLVWLVLAPPGLAAALFRTLGRS